MSNSNTRTDDAVIDSITTAYQQDVIDETTLEDLVEHRFEQEPKLTGISWPDRVRWAGVVTCLALAAISVVGMLASVGAGVVSGFETMPSVLLLSLMGLLMFGPAGFIGLDIMEQLSSN